MNVWLNAMVVHPQMVIHLNTNLARRRTTTTTSAGTKVKLQLDDGRFSYCCLMFAVFPRRDLVCSYVQEQPDRLYRSHHEGTGGILCYQFSLFACLILRVCQQLTLLNTGVSLKWTKRLMKDMQVI